MVTAICPNPSVDKIYDLDGFRAGKVNRCKSVRAFPGGKGVHVGLALKELGTHTKILGFWGGPTGEWIQKKCLKKGVGCGGPALDEWARTCITIHSDGRYHNTEILETGPSISAEHLLDFFDTVRLDANKSKAVCVSGSWPDETPDGVYQLLKTICDFQKTDLWVDASGKNLEHALGVRPFGIHINRSEAAGLFGGGSNPVDYTRKLLDFCTTAALTDGADGLYLGYQDEIYHAACAVDDVLSTVGAGDCLTAGLLHAWYQNMPVPEAARIAVACGAANCINPDLGMLRKTDVDTFAQKTVINNIS